MPWCPSLRGRGLASPRTQPAPADSRPLSRGGEARPASRAPSGPWRSGPGPRLSRLPAPFLPAVRGGGGGDRQAGARCRTRAPRTRTWRVDREGHRAPAGLRRSRGHAATAAPTGGAQSRPRPGQALRAAPRRCRSALTLARARAPSATLAPKHPATAQAGAAALQTTRQSASSRPLYHLPETSLCHMSLGTLPNTPTYAHTPTRPRTHGQGRVQTRTVTGTPAFADTH